MDEPLLTGGYKKVLLIALLVAASPFFASAQSPQPGDIIITEFMANPSATNDSDGEYVELYNKRSISFNIDGFTLSDDESSSHVIDDGGTLTIPAESFIVLARSGSPGFTPDYVYSSFTLSNSDDEIILTDTNGNEIARLNYTESQVFDGISSELNDIGNVDANGQAANTDYVDSEGNIGNGDNGTPGSAGSTSVVESPTVRFLNDESTISENSGNNAVAVVIEDPDGNDVDVDVVLETSGSSADGSDFNDSSPVTLSFNSPSDGDQLTAYPITNDGNFEGSEKAVFTLSNLNTSGSATIAAPGILTLSIEDDDKPAVLINEFLADPPNNMSGDANGDNTQNEDDDEFIEIVNNASFDVDISGWQLSDDGGSNITHTFPDGTVLPEDGAAVVFGGGEPSGNFGGAIIQTTSSLSLSNSSGSVTLLDNNGDIVQDISYGSAAGDGQSITRAPDISGNLETKHSEGSGSGGSIFSPGTKIDGIAFGSKYAIGIRGSEGWRMISVPTSSTSFDDLFGGFWMQGIAGSDDPGGGATISSWDETSGTFNAPSNMDDPLTPGKGYIVYFFEDDRDNTPGIQGGFPKVVNTNGTENSNVSVTVTANDTDESGSIDNNEGWNLLGNPYGTDLSVAALIDALEAPGASVTSEQIQVWDHSAGGGQGSYVMLEDGDRLAPFQAFWIRYTSDGIDQTITLNRSNLAANAGAEYYKESASRSEFEFSLSLSDGTYFDKYSVEFNDNGTIELDRYDAYKLFSMNENSINFYSLIQNNKLTKNALPRNLENALEIPLGFDAPNRSSLTLSWENIENIPDDWEVLLRDTETGEEIDLFAVDEYSFNVQSGESQQNMTNERRPVLNKTKSGNGNSRFVLSVVPPAAQNSGNSEQIPESVQLNPNYPNPFNPSTTISYELTDQAHVTLNVYTIVGQRVATLVDEVRDAGEHDETWNASDMPSGIYIAQLEVQGNVYIRKMTLIK